MDSRRYHKLGIEKATKLSKNFDELYEIYKEKAVKAGYGDELKFVTEHGRVSIYVVL